LNVCAGSLNTVRRLILQRFLGRDATSPDPRCVLQAIDGPDNVRLISLCARCRPECGWNWRGVISGKLKVSDQAARSIG
jgi:hypothetical protein